MRNHLAKIKLNKLDEAWVVIDMDRRDDKLLKPLWEWAQRQPNFRFALSNPQFEYWLLLHFEDGKSNASKSDCAKSLKRHLPAYRKSLDLKKFTPERVERAIRHAKERDNPPCQDWPRDQGCTTVYRLVENILKG